VAHFGCRLDHVREASGERAAVARVVDAQKQEGARVRRGAAAQDAGLDVVEL
jgi:predicted transcriptional regulator